MDSPPHKLNVGRDEDRISALPDDLLLGILERLDLPEAVRAGAFSTRWRHLPHRLSHLHLNASQFHRATPLEGMDAFTAAARSFLAERDCDCNASRAIKSINLGFFVSAPHLSSIGRAVEAVVSRGETKRLHFAIASTYQSQTDPQLAENAEFGQQFMSFSSDYPVAFRWLTSLTLKNLMFGHTDISDLISACNKLRKLALCSCRLHDQGSALKIDTPSSGLRKLDIIRFRCKRIELISVPELRTVMCCSRRYKNPPVRFGDVPQLLQVNLGYHAKAWQAPFTLSECLSRGSRNLSKLNLNFFCETIWIQPEQSKQLTAIFRNLTDVGLFGIFPECDLSWTLFILEAAPSLKNFKLSRTRHVCEKKPDDTAEKTNVVWEPSKDLKHLNLKLLMMLGFEEEVKVTNYIRLVMEHAVGLKSIKLYGEDPFKECNAIDPRISQLDEASRHRIKEQLILESSSSVKIIIG